MLYFCYKKLLIFTDCARNNSMHKTLKNSLKNNNRTPHTFYFRFRKISKLIIKTTGGDSSPPVPSLAMPLCVLKSHNAAAKALSQASTKTTLCCAHLPYQWHLFSLAMTSRQSSPIIVLLIKLVLLQVYQTLQCEIETIKVVYLIKTKGAIF